MIKLIIAAVLSLSGSFVGAALAKERDACSKPAVQELCGASCSTLCGNDVAFLQQNRSFCAPILTGENDPEDDAVCASMLPMPSETGSDQPFGNDPAPPQNSDTSEEQQSIPAARTTEDTGEDCSKFDSRSEQLRCEQNRKGRPICSITAVALEDDASLLVTEVRQELQQYGELLARDLTDIASRDLLCEFSLEELDANYQRATKDPEALKTIQRRADGIQECRREWEDYLRNRATSPAISDIIVENTAEASRRQFEPLVEQLENLSRSITKLEQAASTIDGLIIIHIDFCAPEGTKASNEE